MGGSGILRPFRMFPVMDPDRKYYEHVSELVDKTSALLPESHRADLRPASHQKLRRLAVKALLALLVVTAVLYIGDYVALRFRVATNHAPFGTVPVDQFYAIHKKAGRIEF